MVIRYLILLLALAVSAAAQTPEPTCSLASGELPPGITLASDGAITGTPTTDGAFGFKVSCTAEGAVPVEKDYVIIIRARWTVTIETLVLAEGRIGIPYSDQIQVTVTEDVATLWPPGSPELNRCISDHIIATGARGAGVTEEDLRLYRECVERAKQVAGGANIINQRQRIPKTALVALRHPLEQSDL